MFENFKIGYRQPRQYIPILAELAAAGGLILDFIPEPRRPKLVHCM